MFDFGDATVNSFRDDVTDLIERYSDITRVDNQRHALTVADEMVKASLAKNLLPGAN